MDLGYEKHAAFNLLFKRRNAHASATILNGRLVNAVTGKQNRNGRCWREAAVRMMLDLECPFPGPELISLKTAPMSAYDRPGADVGATSLQIRAPGHTRGRET